MFNIKHFKLVKDLKGRKLKTDWLKFSLAENGVKTRDELLNSIIKDNSFVKEDLKLRAMVEKVLQKEFKGDIKNMKSYDLIVDAVVYKLKKEQLGNAESLE